MTIEAPQPFDSTAYWIERGKNYINEGRLRSTFYAEQELFIVNTVRSLNPKSILELGCGYGRITRRLADMQASIKPTILGVDVSQDQIIAARTYCNASNAVFLRADICNVLPVSATFDLALAVEVLLHIPPDDLVGLIRSIFRVAPVFIHDFDREWLDVGSPHVFNHDYAAIYESLGLKVEQIYSGEHSLMVVTC